MSLTTAFAVFSILVLSACGGAGPGSEEPVAEETPDRLVVYTVNYPLAYFAERLGGDEVEVVFPAPADRDPAFWSPDAGAIAAYQGAGLILLNGAGYAKWVERATLPIAKMVNTTTGVGDRLLELNDTVTHSHGPGGEHEHRGWAFTTWLDPTLAIEQARTVAAALSSRLPSSKTDIAERMGMLEYELVILDTRLAAATEALGDEPLIFSHPVYQYLIARYGLKVTRSTGSPAWRRMGRCGLSSRTSPITTGRSGCSGRTSRSRPRLPPSMSAASPASFSRPAAMDSRARRFPPSPSANHPRPECCAQGEKTTLEIPRSSRAATVVSSGSPSQSIHCAAVVIEDVIELGPHLPVGLHIGLPVDLVTVQTRSDG